MAEQFFPYRRDMRWKALFATLGVGADDGVTVSADHVRATYGRFTVTTPRANVVGSSITGPHRWYTAVGMRLSFADDGLTFGTNHHRGLCIEFAEPIRRVIGFRDHSTLWVSVDDVDGLAATLAP